jgi:hypothetical protein
MNNSPLAYGALRQLPAACAGCPKKVASSRRENSRMSTTPYLPWPGSPAKRATHDLFQERANVMPGARPGITPVGCKNVRHCNRS